MNKFTPGTTATAKSICDQDCIFTLEVIKRTAKTITATFMGETKRFTIKEDEQGNEFVKGANYSMAPIFRA